MEEMDCCFLYLQNQRSLVFYFMLSQDYTTELYCLKSIQKLEIVNHDTIIQKQLAQFKLQRKRLLGKLNLIATQTEPGETE